MLGKQTVRIAQDPKAKVIERQYGEYAVRICFAEQGDPSAAQNVMSAITQAFRSRLDRAYCVTGKL